MLRVESVIKSFSEKNFCLSLGERIIEVGNLLLRIHDSRVAQWHKRIVNNKRIRFGFKIILRLQSCSFVLHVLNKLINLIKVHKDSTLDFLEFHHILSGDIPAGWLGVKPTWLHLVAQLLQENVPFQRERCVPVGKWKLLLHLSIQFGLFLDLVPIVFESLQAELFPDLLEVAQTLEPDYLMVALLSQLAKSLGVQFKHRFVKTLVGHLVCADEVTCDV